MRVLLTVERRLVNPLVERLLRSRLHWLLSGRLAVVDYRGRVSGDRFSTPVLYERDGADVVVTTLREPVVWWRNFREEHPATLLLAGERVPTVGRAVTDPAAVADWCLELAARSRPWRLLFRRWEIAAGSSRRDLEAAAENVVVVRFRPAD